MLLSSPLQHLSIYHHILWRDIQHLSKFINIEYYYVFEFQPASEHSSTVEIRQVLHQQRMVEISQVSSVSEDR